MNFSKEIQTARGEVEQRPWMARLDVRREHSGRRLGRAHAGRPIIDNVDRSAATGQLVGDRATDNSGADHDDVAWGGHE